MRDLLLALHSYFISPLLTLLFFAIFIYVVMSWLFASNMIDGRNQTARNIWNMLEGVIEPLAKPLRKTLPTFGRLDLSVLVIILAIPFVRDYAIPRLIMLVPI